MRIERQRANLCAPDFCCKNVICGINKITTRSYGGPRAGQALRSPVNGGWEGAGPGDWRVKWGGRVPHPDAHPAQQAHWGLGAGRRWTQSTQAVDKTRGLSITRFS